MTKIQKKKNAAHNRAKQDLKAHVTKEDIAKIKSDIRRQEAEANERIQEKAQTLEDQFRAWTDDYNQTVAPALSLGMLLSVCRVSSKWLAKDIREAFFDDVCKEMQSEIDAIGERRHTWKQLQQELLEKYGYEVPLWAESPEYQQIADKIN